MLRRVLAAVVAIVTIAGVAHAGDGRLEISQSCIATGCFPGDSPGFPVETTAAQSYVLTSSLTVPDADTRAVTLAARAVLDLNGFEIAGPTVCTGAPASCSAAATGDGVYAQDHALIRNGTIRGMGRYGIAGQVGVTVERVLVIGNASTGIYLNYGNDGPEAHLIRESRVLGNGGSGILNAGGQGGIGNQISNCVIQGNKDYGLFVMMTLVVDNSVSRNGLQGMYGTDTGYARNTFTYNNGGNANAQVIGNATQIGTNFCGVDAACP